MPTIPPRVATALLACAAVALLVPALALQGASATLLSPLPAWLVAVGMGAWLAVCVPLVWLVANVPGPRLVGRLLVVGSMALAGWGLGTATRGAFVLLVFAVSDLAARERVSFQVLPGAAAGRTEAGRVTVMSFALRTDVAVPFTAAAMAELGRGFVCVDLVVEQTESGVTRIVRPAAPIDVDELGPCDG